MTGLIIQPIIGALSDRTWSPKWGKAETFFCRSHYHCSIAFIVYAIQHVLVDGGLLLWIFGCRKQYSHGGAYRAFIADKLPKEQYPLGFKPSLFTGLGITLFLLPFSLPILARWSATGIPYWVYGSFIVGSIISISTVSWSLFKTLRINLQKKSF